MITGRDIVFISSIEWDFLWQIHQEIAFRFAAAGNRVVYIENTGVRAPGLKDTGRVLVRLQHWIQSLFSQGMREVAPNIFVISPLIMPPFGTLGSGFLNRRLFLPMLRRVMQRIGVTAPFLWTYLPTDTAVDLIRSLSSPHSVVMYYCGADFSLLTPDENQCRESEDALLRLSDLVFATCAQLVERCRVWNDDVHLVPAIVNLEAFSLKKMIQVRGDPTGGSESASSGSAVAAGLQRPIIGYVGGLHRFLDYQLLVQMIRARPGWSWVFVGAVTSDTGGLTHLGNAYLLGQRPHSQLAEYIQEFDVCMVPYLNNPLTATVVPMKLNEYLAMGKPVVSTELPTVSEFNSQHRILTTAPNEPVAFLRAIEAALSLPEDERTAQRRREVAALGDSQKFVATIGDLIDGKLREKASGALMSRCPASSIL